MKPVLRTLLTAGLLITLGSNSHAETNQLAHSEQTATTPTERDPFWPVGFAPAAPEAKEDIDASDDPTAAPVEADIEWPALPVQGRSRSSDGTYLALIDGIGIVRPGEQVAIQRGDLWFTWQIDAISSQGLQVRRIGVTRIPPTGALTPR